MQLFRHVFERIKALHPQNAPTLDELATRLHPVTGWPIRECKRFLRMNRWFLGVDIVEYVALVETQGTHIVHDPIEDEPQIRPIFLAVCEEARRLVDEKYPGRTRGTCHARWGEIKRILHERHNIKWRSLGELNPWVIFD